MTTITPQVTPFKIPPEFPGLYHVTCCKDEDPGDIAFCGADVTGQPWGKTPNTQDCFVCAELEKTDFCPIFGTCSG